MKKILLTMLIPLLVGSTFQLAGTEKKSETYKIFLEKSKKDQSFFNDAIENNLKIMNEQMAYFTILGVGIDTSEKDIKTAYRKLSLKWHPDKNKSPDATDMMQKINAAYVILSDPKQIMPLKESIKETAEHIKGLESSKTSNEDLVKTYEKRLSDELKAEQLQAEKLQAEKLQAEKLQADRAPKKAMTPKDIFDYEAKNKKLPEIDGIKQTDLRGVNMSGWDLSGHDLSGADLTGSDLSNIKFDEKSRPKFKGTDVSGVNFKGAKETSGTGKHQASGPLSKSDLKNWGALNVDKALNIK